MFRFQRLVFALLLNRISAAIRSGVERHLSEGLFISYEPLTTVTDHAAIDLDQKALEEQLATGTKEGMEIARDIYQQGGHSKSYAVLKLDNALENAAPAGTEVLGKASNGDAVRGGVMTAADPGTTVLEVQYDTTAIQDTYVGCQVGGLGEPNMEKCFQAQGSISVGVSDGITYTYDPETNNDNARTLQGFSSQAKEKMYDCEFCPYPTYEKFYNYYAEYDYGDKWVTAAFNKGQTGFSGNGNADFSQYQDEGLVEAIKKGTAYMNVWMYVIREFEDSIDDCNNDCSTEECNDDQVHAWDEGVAFYTGSIPKATGEGGYLLYTLAQKRCENFNTCMKSGADAGMAAVNNDIFRLFSKGKQELQQGNCGAAKETVAEITKLMTIPLVQGTLRYAHIQAVQNQRGEKQNAEGAIFAAAVLPIVHDCDANDAAVIYNNMRVGGALNVDFDAVKAAFEGNYDCMGITCAQVGGLLQPDGETYFGGAEPCGDGSVVGETYGSSATTYGFNVAAACVAAAFISLIYMF